MNDRLNSRAVMKAINAWAASEARGLRASGGHGGFSLIQFHTRPDPRAPEVQISLVAAIVDGQAVIQIPELDSPRPEDRDTRTTRGDVAEARFEQPIETAASAR